MRKTTLAQRGKLKTGGSECGGELLLVCQQAIQRLLKLDDLRDFIACYNPENRHERRETERFKYFSYEELMARDKASLDIFWLKDDSLENLDDLPPPDVLQQEIIEHLEAALAAFRDVASGLPRLARAEDGR